MTDTQEEQVKGLLTEQENLIRQQTEEIEALREKLRRTETKEDRQTTGGGALCAGCYHYRLWFAALIGMTCAVLGSRTLHPRQALVRMMGREDGADAALIALVLLTAAAPVLATIAEWKWTQFKHGAPGALRTVADVWGAMSTAVRGRK